MDFCHGMVRDNSAVPWMVTPRRVDGKKELSGIHPCSPRLGRRASSRFIGTTKSASFPDYGGI